MIQRIIIFFYLIGFVSGQSYFLNESDFQSRFEALKSEIEGVPHIIVWWDSSGRVSKKDQKDKNGDLIKSEQFYYDGLSEEIIQKDIFSSSRNLVEQTVFGPELHAEEFIKYLYQIDTVKVWQNRFTRTLFNPNGEAYLHEFYDVDGFQFGEIGFSFNEDNILTSQLWIVKPSKKIIRQWSYDYDPFTEVTRIIEFDSLNVVVDDVSLYKDGTHSVFWFTGPEESSFIKEPRLSFLLQNDMEWGRIVFTPSEGSTDTVTSRILQLQGDKLERGEFNNVKFILNPPLVDGQSYDVAVEGKSSRGMIITRRTIKNLRYDETPPEMELNLTRFINAPEIEFKTNEALSSATLIFKPDSLLFPNKEEIRVFIPKDSYSNAHLNRIIHKSDIVLEDSVIYNVMVSGLDKAGNRGYSNIRENVIYDISPPVLSLNNLVSNSAVNNSDLIIDLSEDLQTLDIVYTPTGGLFDPDLPRQGIYSPSQLSRGLQTLGLSSDNELKDGSQYSINISGVDSAGNKSEPISVANILFDITPPVITMIFPFDNSAIKEPSISFSISEDLENAVFSWIPDSLLNDTVPKLEIQLTSDERKAGSAIHQILEGQTDLTDGAIYSIIFNGNDRAGNQAETVLIKDIVYDITPPRFIDLLPEDGSFRNDRSISYTISENLKEGSLIWEAIGGAKDKNSPYKVALQSDELLGGSHPGIIPQSTPYLNDSTSYRISFMGSDFAGNLADTVKIDSFHYDISPPLISIDYPLSGNFINDSLISFSVSEILTDGKFIWTPSDTSLSYLMNLEIQLSSKYLKPGNYDNIKFTEFPSLVEGATYDLTFIGKDRAGNVNPKVIVEELVYDFQPPVLSLTSPENDTAINSKALDYSFNEILKEGTIVWEWVKGNPDEKKVHRINLEQMELSAGEYGQYITFNEPNLVNNAFYNIWLEGTDLAGNSSISEKVLNVEFDNIVPVMSVSNLSDRIWTNSIEVDYENSEQFHDQRFTWINVDDSTELSFELEKEYRSSGVHPNSNIVSVNDIIEGQKYNISVTGRDRAGNQAEPINFSNVKYDFTAPQIALNWPLEGSAINSFLHSYRLSETMMDLELKWTWKEGKGGSNDSDTQTFTDLQKEFGDYNDELPKIFPKITDGGIYDLELYGQDSAGNKSNVVSVKNVLYDITPPVITVQSPQPQKYIASPAVSLTFSENVHVAEIIYKNTGGVVDSLDSHIFELSGDQLLEGLKTKLAENEEFLVEGAAYTITVNAADRAGNTAEPVSIPGVVYDATPPVLAIHSPLAPLSVNHKRIKFETSEMLQTGSLIWTRIEGANDPNSPHEINLENEDLFAGIHEIDMSTRSLNLVDSAIYQISYTGTDPAGNKGDPAIIKPVVYDISPPVLAIAGLSPDSYINKPVFQFSTSEDLKEGRFIWSGTKGTGEIFDFVHSLKSENLSAAEYSTENIFDPDLSDGGNYSILFTASDLAGNQAKPIEIRNINYDITPPVVSFEFPQNAQVFNTYKLDYNISEPVINGEIIVTNAESEHSISLTNAEMQMGRNSIEKLTNWKDLPELVEHNLSLSVIDRAGNRSNSAILQKISYDFTPPTLALNNIQSNSYINSRAVSGNYSEKMNEVDLVWANSYDTIRIVMPESQLGTGQFDLSKYSGKIEQNLGYDIFIEGFDLAGNFARSSIIENVIFDSIPPFLSVVSPTRASEVNNSSFTYTTSEELKELTVNFNESGDSKNMLELEGEYLKLGQHSHNGTGLSLLNGKWYSINISGVDLAGNSTTSEAVDSIKFDIQPPVIVLNSPSSDIFTNQMILQGNISESISSGLITLKFNGETSGNTIPFTIDNIDDQGDFYLNLAELNHIPVDSGMIDISMIVTDIAGNNSEIIKRDNINFDMIPPQLVISDPLSKEFITSGELSYSISEEISEGAITYQWVGGTGDESLTQVIELSNEERSPGKHELIKSSRLKSLQDGAVYNISLTATDKAGNSGASNFVEKLKYDITPPTGNIKSPESSMAYNKIFLNLEMSEPMMELKLLVKPEISTIGKEGAIDLATVPWANNSIVDLDLGKSYNFSNDTKYTFTLTGKDSAGNALNPMVITDLSFDNIPPVFSMAMPVDAEQIKETIISYNLSEKVKKASVTYINETIQVEKPVTYDLSISDLSLGWHQDVLLPIKDSLRDGSRYTIMIEGEDLAGNKGAPIQVKNVLFDFMPPVLAVFSPRELPYVNEEIISYSSSEELKTGSFTFTRIGGTQDPASPHNFVMTGKYLRGGKHDKELLEGLSLVDGTVYEISFNGSDLANNQGETAKLGKLTVDKSSPEILSIAPDSSAYMNSFDLSYRFSEDLFSGKIIVNGPGQSIIEYDLTPIDLSSRNDVKIDLMDRLGLLLDGNYELTLTGSDSAGNILPPFNLSGIVIDREKPEITHNYPSADSRFNKTQISYGISENLKDLTINYNSIVDGKVGGVVKSYKLSPDKMIFGNYEGLPLEDLETVLVSDNPYLISYTAEDLAGNKSTLEIRNVTYDNEGPVATLISPSGRNISDVDVDFSLNEYLAKGRFIWTPLNGESQIISEFNDLELQNLSFGPGKLANQIDLKDGNQYSLTFAGEDLAGNTSNQVLRDTLIFDKTPPVFTNIYPVDKKVVNRPDYNFDINEDLISGLVSWVDQETQVSQILELSGINLKQGTHNADDVPLPLLEDGKLYSMTIEGTDLAGNASEPITISDVKYDITPPVLEIVKPDTGDFTNKTSFGIKTSEQLEFGRILLENTGGIVDPESPRILEIKGNKLTPVKPAGQKLGLIDGAVYTIRFEGRDYAGNEGVTIEVPQVTFDNTLPTLSINYPITDKVHNNKTLTYTLSENLLDGRITWTVTGGKNDPGAPYVMILEGDQLTAGTHTDSLEFPFVEGTVYSIEIAGRDLAENEAIKYKTAYVSYDFTKPIIELLPLEYGKYVNHKKLTFKSSEPLFDGKITWYPISNNGEPLVGLLTENESTPTLHKDLQIANVPDLQDGTKYKVVFTGRDKAGNYGDESVIEELIYDITPPTIDLLGPADGTVMLDPELSLKISEPMRLAIIYWNATEGAVDTIGHYEIKLTPEELVKMEFEDYTFKEQVPLNVGTVYSMSITGLDSAWNEVPLQGVEDLYQIRKLDGNWYFKGAIMTVVWTFEPTGGKYGETGRFSQGVQMGTKISNQESGTYKLDYSKRPWTMEWELESGQKRYSLFEIKGKNKLRVVTGTKMPESWQDGEVMNYENK